MEDKKHERDEQDAQGPEDSGSQDQDYEGGKAPSNDPPPTDPGDPIGPGKKP